MASSNGNGGGFAKSNVSPGTYNYGGPHSFGNLYKIQFLVSFISKKLPIILQLEGQTLPNMSQVPEFLKIWLKLIINL